MTDGRTHPNITNLRRWAVFDREVIFEILETVCLFKLQCLELSVNNL